MRTPFAPPSVPHAVHCVLQCRMHGACCDVLHRVAPGCNGLHVCAVSVSVGHIRSVTVHVDWPTRSVAVEISGACYSRCRVPAPQIHGLTPITSGPARGSLRHVCIGTAPAPATSKPGLASPLQYRDPSRSRARVLQRRSHAHSRTRAHPAPSAHDGSPAQASPCAVGIHTSTSPTEWLQWLDRAHARTSVRKCAHPGSAICAGVRARLRSAHLQSNPVAPT